MHYRQNNKIFAMKEISKVKALLKKSINSIRMERAILKNIHYNFISNLYFSFQDMDFLRAEEISPFSEVFPYLRGLLIQRVAGSDESNDAARTHLVKRLGEEIVVDGEAELVVRLIVHLIVAEGDVADGKIEKVFAVSGLKTA